LLVLASESARRVDLLTLAGYRFEAMRSGFPEVTLEHPRQTVETNARGKALAVAEGRPDDVVLGSDTVVYLPLEGRTLGQAGDEAEVVAMLSVLRGARHEVYSGVAVVHGASVSVYHSVTAVRMRGVSDAELRDYAATSEGVGKAGGYAIQGRAAAFVEWIGGDYSNVVGLPLALTGRMLAEVGVLPAWRGLQGDGGEVARS
jgi:septum formation protein